MTIKVNDTATFNIALGMSLNCDPALVEYIVTVWDKKTGTVDKKLFRDGEFRKAVDYFSRKEAEFLGENVNASSTDPETTPCPFCEELKRVKETNEWYQKNSPRHADTWNEYKVALVSEGYCKSVDWCTSIVTSRHMELNFCPVCGKKIEL